MLYTVEDLTKRYGVTDNTVLMWINSGQLKAINVGRKPGAKRPRWRVTQAALDAFEVARTPTTPTPRAPRAPRARRRSAAEVVQFYS